MQRIDGHSELSFDESTSARLCRCLVHREERSTPLEYGVQWRDSVNGRYIVGLSPDRSRAGQRGGRQDTEAWRSPIRM